MGLFFRKIKKLGLFNVNFSKSGIGISCGVKGLRVGFNSKGPYVSAGRNGVYYRKSLNKIISESQEKAPVIENEPKTNLCKIADIELTGRKRPISEICDMINKRKFCIKIGWFLLLVLFFNFYPYGAAISIILAFWYSIIIYGLNFIKTDITSSCLERNSEIQDKYNVFTRAFAKYTASYHLNMGTTTTWTGGDLPQYCKMSNKDLKLPTFRINKTKYMFGSDFIIIFAKGKYTSYFYNEFDMPITLKTVHLKTEEILADEEIVDVIYKHTKKDGTPDLRYKDNEIYISKFIQFSFLGENWLCSNETVLENFVKGLKIINPDIEITDKRNESPEILDYTNGY